MLNVMDEPAEQTDKPYRLPLKAKKFFICIKVCVPSCYDGIFQNKKMTV